MKNNVQTKESSLKTNNNKQNINKKWGNEMKLRKSANTGYKEKKDCSKWALCRCLGMPPESITEGPNHNPFHSQRKGGNGGGFGKRLAAGGLHL